MKGRSTSDRKVLLHLVDNRSRFERGARMCVAGSPKGFPIHKKTPYLKFKHGVLDLKPGSDLLSHGETPHYHRR